MTHAYRTPPRSAVLTALCLAVTAPALACPTAEDVEGGIEVTYADATRSVITRDATGEVRETEYWQGDPPVTYIAANGLIETGYLEAHADAGDMYSYTFETSDLVPVRPWLVRSGLQITVDAGGAELDRVPFTLRTRGETIREIGDCAFRVIPVETYYYTPGDPSMVEFAFLIDLGIPINIGYAYLAGGIGAAEPTIPVAIRAAHSE